jgi:ribosomal protein S6
MFKSAKQQIDEMNRLLPNDENFMGIELYRKHYERMMSVQSDPEKIKEMEATYQKNMSVMLSNAVKREQERRRGA